MINGQGGTGPQICENCVLLLFEYFLVNRLPTQLFRGVSHCRNWLRDESVGGGGGRSTYVKFAFTFIVK